MVDGADELRKERLFAEALELPAAERAAFVEQAVGPDEGALRDELIGLLEVGEGGAFLGSPAWERLERLPERVGPYRVTGELGRGGMGVVLRAEQDAPLRRSLALKLLRPGPATRDVLARFEAERQTLARLDHPAIATIHDAGTTDDGRPYFAMELVEGAPITGFCDARGMSLAARLELFERVCDAVQYAHQKGVIHRDLKPSNVLVVDAGTGGPAPKVIDFGIAKAVGGADAEGGDAELALTRAGELVGTPEAMSPEQADLGGDDLDTRTDVYSLGVLLYELVSGALPFDPARLRAAGFREMNRILREEVPPRPSQRVAGMAPGDAEDAATARGRSVAGLERALRGDVDWIVARALEKDRERRYASASELGADVHRHLAGEPVLAGPPSARYRASKFIARHRVQVGAAAAVFVSLVVGVVAVTWNAVELGRSRDALAREQRVAEAINRFLREDILGAADPRSGGRGLTLREALDLAAASIGDRFAGDPEVEVGIRQTIGDTYRSLGELDLGIEQLERAAELAREHLRETDELRMRAIGDLAIAYDEANRGADAEPIYLEQLALQRSAFGATDRRTLQTSVNLASLYATLSGRVDDAERTMRGALEGYRERYGDEDGDTIVTKQHLANLLISLDRFGEARELLEEAHASSVLLRGAEHPYTIAAMGALSKVLVGLGDTDGAERLQREGLRLSTERLGPDHYMTAQFLGVLASLMRETGRAAQALPLVVDAEARIAGALGDAHTHTCRARHELALVHEALGDDAAALEAHDLCVAGAREVFGEAGHHDLGAWLVARGRCRWALGDRGGARADIAEGRTLLAAALGEESPRVEEAEEALSALDAGQPAPPAPR